MSKSTPGPWVYVFEPDGYRHQILSDDSQVAQVVPSDSSAADGWLIAASPDLLEALDECLGTLVICFPDAPVDSVIGKNIINARAAIAKATGGEA